MTAPVADAEWNRKVGDWLGPRGEDRWWEPVQELERVEAMLRRAGVLRDAKDVEAYREKPWHWSRERRTCDVLEGAMRDAHVLPERGWDMSVTELMQAAMDAEGPHE